MKDIVEVDKGGVRGGYEGEEDITDEKDFKKILFEVQYQTENRKDILTTGKVYKPKIKKKMEDFLMKTKQKHLQFYIVFHITLVKETRDGIIEQVKNPSS